MMNAWTNGDIAGFHDAAERPPFRANRSTEAGAVMDEWVALGIVAALLIPGVVYHATLAYFQAKRECEGR
jgi:hypothetical protein